MKQTEVCAYYFQATQAGKIRFYEIMSNLPFVSLIEFIRSKLPF